MMRLESWGPCLFAMALTAGYTAIPALRNYKFPAASLSAVFNSVVTIAGIAVGFLATVKAILLSIDQRRVIRQLKQVDAYNRLIGYLMAAVNLAFVLAGASAAAMLFDFTAWGSLEKILFFVWFFLLWWTTASCYRVIRCLSCILKSP